MSSERPLSSTAGRDYRSMSQSRDDTPTPQPRSSSLRQIIPSNDSNTSSHPSPPRRSQSDRPQPQRITSHPQENDLPPLPQTGMSPEARRQSIMAMDRKRRLTAGSHETGRRRTTTGGFTSRDNRYYQTSSRRDSRHSLTSAPPQDNVEPPEVIDLTSSSPPQPSSLVVRPDLSSSAHRTSSNGSRGYVVPRWQSDGDVSECPICHRAFGFLFRRHHCRKCGRVVCNDCSPHRITIPRQYIVHPPGTVPDPLSPADIPTIDLTRTEDEDDTRYAGLNAAYRRANPALGGGEKVRLCNPCVPDPQPELQTVLREGPQHQEDTAQSHLSLPPGLTTFPQFPRYPPLQHPSHSDAFHIQPPHPGTRIRLDVNEEDDEFDSSPELHPNVPRRHIMDLAQNRYHPAMSSSMHSRYHSLDSRQAPLPLLPPFATHHRPRISSMLDAAHNYQGRGTSSFPFGMPVGPSDPRVSAPLQLSSSTSHIPRPPRPRIREEDMCPICRGLLPPKGPDDDETDRESHIMACISQHDTSSTPTSRSRILSSGAEAIGAPLNPAFSRSLPAAANIQTQTFGNSGPTIPIASSSTAPVRPVIPSAMVRFTATEKDCGPSEGGEAQECSICMVEYDVGDRLVRLECWCKFHEECIVEWFGRKAECPVHKLS